MKKVTSTLAQEYTESRPRKEMTKKKWQCGFTRNQDAGMFGVMSCCADNLGSTGNGRVFAPLELSSFLGGGADLLHQRTQRK